MTKPTVVKLFWGSLIALVAGLVFIGISLALAISNDILIMNGAEPARRWFTGATLTALSVGI
jgi:hypothetical protein